MTGLAERNALAATVERLAEDPAFLAAHAFAAPDRGAALGRRLGLDEASTLRLLLCRAPRPGRFAEDVAAIAGSLEMDAAGLAAGLRETAALTALAHLAQATGAAGEPVRPRPGLLAAAHDLAASQPQTDGTDTIWLREQAEGFWAAAPEDVHERRDVEAAIAWVAPLTVVALPGLGLRKVETWLAGHGVPFDGDAHDRPLRGLLVAARGTGIVFLDGTMPSPERRMTVAHELGHFLLDYLQPRQRVLSELPDLLEVVDGWRPPTRAERTEAVLARVPIGLRTHLLERDVHGAGAFDVEAGEDAASRFALELLAPWPTVLDLARSVHRGQATPSLEALVEALTPEIGRHFDLPPQESSVRARAALAAIGIRRSFFDR